VAEKRIDVWLNRISQITQLGLFILAIAGLYYTVIPLYQKAVVDEELAKKEVQLKELDAKINEMYASARKIAVAQVIYAAGADCSGLLTPPQPMPLMESLVTGKPYKAIPPEEMPPKFEDVVMGTPIKDCMEKQASKHQAASILRPEDRAILEGRMMELGAALDAERLKMAPRFKLSSEHEQHNMAMSLSKRIMAEVLTLNKIQWNEAQQSVPADRSRPAGEPGG
jgi:hypothetical protein